MLYQVFQGLLNVDTYAGERKSQLCMRTRNPPYQRLILQSSYGYSVVILINFVLITFSILLSLFSQLLNLLYLFVLTADQIFYPP